MRRLNINFLLLIGIIGIILCAAIAVFATGCGLNRTETETVIPPSSGTEGDGENSGGSTVPPSDGDGNTNGEHNEGEKPDDTEKPEEKRLVIFVAENFEFTVPYEEGDVKVSEPAVPAKYGYTGAWQQYDLSNGGTVTVHAVYELRRFRITFVAENFFEEYFYTVFDEEITPPPAPKKKGYTTKWRDFTLSYDGDVTVECEYTLIYYKIIFPDGENAVIRTYTVLDSTIKAPEVPYKPFYTGKWTYGELTFGEDMTATAVYEKLPASSVNLFKWKLNAAADGYILEKYTGDDEQVIVPAEYNNKPVTEIFRYAFTDDGVKPITAISIGDNVKTIGNFAFDGLFSLVYAELPEGLEAIGNYSFANTGLTGITLPQSLKKIGAGAFNGSAIASLRIPDGIEELGDYAFINCKMLQTLDTGSGLKIIPVNAFENCTALKSVIIGESVETIEEKAFAKCISLEKAVFIDTYYWFDYNVQSQITAAFTQAQIRDTVWAANLLVNSSCNVIYKDDGLFCVKLMSLAPFKKGMEKGKVVRNRVIANATLFYDFTIFEYHLRSDFRRLFNRIKVLFNTVSKII